MMDAQTGTALLRMIEALDARVQAMEVENAQRRADEAAAAAARSKRWWGRQG